MGFNKYYLSEDDLLGFFESFQDKVSITLRKHRNVKKLRIKRDDFDKLSNKLKFQEHNIYKTSVDKRLYSWDSVKEAFSNINFKDVDGFEGTRKKVLAELDKNIIKDRKLAKQYSDNNDLCTPAEHIYTHAVNFLGNNGFTTRGNRDYISKGLGIFRAIASYPFSQKELSELFFDFEKVNIESAHALLIKQILTYNNNIPILDLRCEKSYYISVFHAFKFKDIVFLVAFEQKDFDSFLTINLFAMLDVDFEVWESDLDTNSFFGVDEGNLKHNNMLLTSFDDLPTKIYSGYDGTFKTSHLDFEEEDFNIFTQKEFLDFKESNKPRYFHKFLRKRFKTHMNMCFKDGVQVDENVMFDFVRDNYSDKMGEKTIYKITDIKSVDTGLISFNNGIYDIDNKTFTKKAYGKFYNQNMRNEGLPFLNPDLNYIAEPDLDIVYEVVRKLWNKTKDILIVLDFLKKVITRNNNNMRMNKEALHPVGLTGVGKSWVFTHLLEPWGYGSGSLFNDDQFESVETLGNHVNIDDDSELDNQKAEIIKKNIGLTKPRYRGMHQEPRYMDIEYSPFHIFIGNYINVTAQAAVDRIWFAEFCNYIDRNDINSELDFSFSFEELEHFYSWLLNSYELTGIAWHMPSRNNIMIRKHNTLANQERLINSCFERGMSEEETLYVDCRMRMSDYTEIFKRYSHEHQCNIEVMHIKTLNDKMSYPDRYETMADTRKICLIPPGEIDNGEWIANLELKEYGKELLDGDFNPDIILHSLEEVECLLNSSVEEQLSILKTEGIYFEKKE